MREQSAPEQQARQASPLFEPDLTAAPPVIHTPEHEDRVTALAAQQAEATQQVEAANTQVRTADEQVGVQAHTGTPRKRKCMYLMHAAQVSTDTRQRKRPLTTMRTISMSMTMARIPYLRMILTRSLCQTSPCTILPSKRLKRSLRNSSPNFSTTSATQTIRTMSSTTCWSKARPSNTLRTSLMSYVLLSSETQARESLRC
jgi:hypothetical protein